MAAVRVERVVETDGEVIIKGLPCKKGQRVDVVVFVGSERKRGGTARQLLESGLVGIWKDRTDIPDSPTFARELRERAQKRGS
jgi:hypothetical protein